MEFNDRIATILQPSKQAKKQSLLVLKITRSFFLKISTPHYTLNEKEQEFVWSYFCLEKNHSVNAYWTKMGGMPSKNDQYIIKIINYLNEFQDKDIILSSEDYRTLEELLTRLSSYNSLRTNKLQRVRVRVPQTA